MKTLAIAGAALALLFGAAGCRETVIDSAKTADTIKAELEKSGLKLKSVDCPDGVEVKKGETFECEVVEASGKKKQAKLRITDSDADLSLLNRAEFE